MPRLELLLEYQEAVDKIKSHPRFPWLACYGGLAWRLVVHFGGKHCLRSILERPSLAWQRYHESGIYCPTFRECSENFQSADKDKLLDVLLGKLPRTDGVSVWPDLCTFLRGYRWKGEWTSNLETWFQKRVAEIRRGTADIHGRGQWGRAIVRLPRTAPSTEGTAELAFPVVQQIGQLGYFADTLMETMGSIAPVAEDQTTQGL